MPLNKKGKKIMKSMKKQYGKKRGEQVFYASLNKKELKELKNVARIIQALTQPDEEYNQQTQQSFVRDVDSIVQKLNTTYQQDLKDESEAEAFFFG
jgi:uncharacterized cupredoxin-like copper-binding protein